jgi:hypothetical protein
MNPLNSIINFTKQLYDTTVTQLFRPDHDDSMYSELEEGSPERVKVERDEMKD